MPLMGSLFTGVSGLQTAQNSLNTTAHNLSNIDTSGYVRQQVLLGTSIYNTIRVSANTVSNQQVGSGVTYSKVRQVRDQFLDQTFRRESGRSAFYDVSLKAIEEVENALGELKTSPFSQGLSDLWSSVQELAKNPASSTIQTLVVQRAAQFVRKSQDVYGELSSYQDNLNIQIKNKVERINEIGDKIKEYNDGIREIETAGIENANDLRDARNKLLDELSGLANIDYDTDAFGNINVRLEGNDFITTSKCYHIELQTDVTNGFYTPYWPQNATIQKSADGTEIINIDNAKVFNMKQTISAATDTDIGELKSMLFARGDHRANYTDLDDGLKGEGYYDTYISQSVMMNVQAEFDQLIHAVVTGINRVLAEASDPATGYLCNEDGSPMQLFTKMTTDAYEFDGSGWNYVPEDPARTETLYTTMNIQVNGDLIKQPTLLNFVRPDKSEDFETVAKMAKLFEEENYILNPNLKTAYNFTDYYNSLISQVSNTGSVMASISSSLEATVENTDAARDQIMGVSSEEELSHMIKYQNAYNAASRYINVIDEMLEHILTTLGAS